MTRDEKVRRILEDRGSKSITIDEALSALNALYKIDEGKLLYILNERNSLGIRLNEQGAEGIAHAIAQKAEEIIK